MVDYFHFDQHGLMTYENLLPLIQKHDHHVRTIFITYPHNPTGKALNGAEAKQVADMINRINQQFPQIIFYNDSVYNGTCAIETGYNSFYTHLSEPARMRTITGASGAKLASMGGERVGGIATKNPLLRELLANAQSQMSAGVSVHSITGFLATTELMRDQWQAGIHPEMPRAQIANFYQSRIRVIADALHEIDQIAGSAATPILRQKPAGGMYVYADFTALLKGKKIPEILQNVIGSKTLETGQHLRDLLLFIYKLNYTPVSTVNGEIFNEDNNKITLRISCVEKNMRALNQAVNTFRGVMQILLGRDFGAKTVDFAQVKEDIR